MKQIAFFLVAVAMVVDVVASTFPASGQNGEAAPNLRHENSPWIS
jgi:hypothetical protein